MRIKPKDIEIDANLPKYPFDNDLLDREEEIINLTDIIQNVEAPLVLAVNAPWGTGKSTFIRLWCAYLEQQNLDFIWFNA
jgi:predicted KAP-like P-loop ATPase